MKKLLTLILIVGGILTSAILLGQAIEKGKKVKEKAKESNRVEAKSTTNNGFTTIAKPKAMSKDHSKANVDCKQCHDCEYPTKKDPCLKMCPRVETSVYHSPDEGPNVVVMDEMSKRYGPVVFSHKIHAQMSEMSHGCDGCHHYNTTGPVLKCAKCHPKDRKREELGVPDLEAAYHRQCMQCHRQWTRSTACTLCHLPKGETGKTKVKETIEKLAGMAHPHVPKPDRVVYDTKHTKARFVTFFHNDHIEHFKIKCTSCHKDENCAKCHDVALVKSGAITSQLHKKANKTFEDHHKPCSNCHDTKNCAKCHSTKEMNPFNHGTSTGFELKSYHAQLACNRCHADNKFAKMGKECTSCHKNFVSGKFDHTVTGLKLSDSHKELDCNSCHLNNAFSKAPECKDCHDDKAFPAQLPGKKITAMSKVTKKK